MIETKDEELVTSNHIKGLGIGNGYVIHAGEKYRVELS